jgi:hypothetical protein
MGILGSNLGKWIPPYLCADCHMFLALLAISPPVIVTCGTPATIKALTGDQAVADNTVIILVDLFK